MMLAPSQLGPAHEATKEAHIERVEDLFKVVEATLGAEEALASARCANDLGLPGDGSACAKALVAQVVRGVDGLLVELSQQNVGDGVDDAFRRALKQIGEAGENLPV